jgi:glycerol-3-phosphate acyltransferase PlsY
VVVVRIVLVVASYLLGTFPTAILVGKRRGVDPTKAGSGNPGATNMYRTAGKSAGALVLVGDIAKGIVPAAIAWGVDARPLAFACWGAAVVGHIFPVYRRLKGGKGVATAGGGVIVLFPIVAAICVALFIVTIKVTKRGSVGSLVICAAVPALAAAFGRPGWEIGVASGVCALVIVRHWSNIKRLVTGNETAVVGSSR